MCIWVPAGYTMNTAGEIRYDGPHFVEMPTGV